MSYLGQYGLPCGDYLYGETEDYTLSVIEADSEYCYAQYHIDYTIDSVFLSLNPVASGEIVALEWFLEEDLVSEEESFNLGGLEEAEVCLHILTDQSCEDTFCQTLDLSCSASYEFENQYSGMYFESTAIGAAGIAAYEWILDGVIVSDEANYYQAEGVQDGQEVCLTIYGYGGCSDTYCESFDLECEALFFYNIYNEEAMAVAFYDSSTVSTYYEVVWDYGNGTYGSSSPNPYEIYEEPNTYEVCMTLIAEDGCTDIHCETFTVGGYYECSELDTIYTESVISKQDTSYQIYWTAINDSNTYEYELIHADTLVTTGITDSTQLTFSSLLACENYTFNLTALCQFNPPFGTTAFATECDTIDVAVTNIRNGQINQIYPNPANQSTILKLQNISTEMELVVLDLFGRVIHQQKIKPNERELMLHTQAWPNGAYFCQLSKNGASISRQKLMVVH